MGDQPVSASGDGNFLGMFRQLSAELRHLYAKVEAFRAAVAKVANSPGDARRQDARAAKETLQYAITQNRAQIAAHVQALHDEVQRRADVRDYWGDQVTEVENLLDEALWLLDKALNGQASRLPAVDDLTAIANYLSDATLVTEYVTVPPRLNQHLKNYRNGQVLRFDKTFESEVPDAHVRPLLEYLYNQPRCVNGIVDVERKTVLKVSPEKWRHWTSFGILVVIVVVFLVGPPLLREFDVVDSWFAKQPKDSQLVGGVVVTFLGALAHLLVGGVKQIRTSVNDDDSRRFVSLDNWIVWTVAHEADLLMALISVGVVGVYFAGGLGETDPVKLLAVGYSADSIIEVVSPKFEAVMKRKRSEIVAT